MWKMKVEEPFLQASKSPVTSETRAPSAKELEDHQCFKSRRAAMLCLVSPLPS